MNKTLVPSLIILLTIISACTPKTSNELPVMGRKKIVEKTEAGQTRYDTLDHTIAPFAFYNQDSTLINNNSVKGKIYVADFFFTSCPTICPKMKKQMLRVYEKYENVDDFTILSHTIDPEYDTVGLLKEYAEALGVSAPKWNFLTGDKDEIYELGETSYMVVADEDSNAPGGYIHSGAFILVDTSGRVRGVYDGTLDDQVDILLMDIDRLLESKGK